VVTALERILNILRCNVTVPELIELNIFEICLRISETKAVEVTIKLTITALSLCKVVIDPTKDDKLLLKNLFNIEFELLPIKIVLEINLFKLTNTFEEANKTRLNILVKFKLDKEMLEAISTFSSTFSLNKLTTELTEVTKVLCKPLAKLDNVETEITKVLSRLLVRETVLVAEAVKALKRTLSFDKVATPIEVVIKLFRRTLTLVMVVRTPTGDGVSSFKSFLINCGVPRTTKDSIREKIACFTMERTLPDVVVKVLKRTFKVLRLLIPKVVVLRILSKNFCRLIIPDEDIESNLANKELFCKKELEVLEELKVFSACF